MLTKKDILAAPDIKKESVNVPEWQGEVWVYGMSGNERDEYESSIVEVSGSGETQTQTLRMNRLRAKLCSLTIRDEEGRRMFDDDELDELGAKSSQALQRIFVVAQRLSGLTKDDTKALSKNLESGQVAASGSGSPDTSK